MRDRIEAATEDRDLGLDLRHAQRVVTSTDAVAWVVPGDRHLCLIQHQTGAGACDATRAAIRNGLALVVFEPPTKPEAVPKRYLALGLAPDGVEEVRMLLGSSSRNVAVVDNVYSLRAVSPPRAAPLR